MMYVIDVQVPSDQISYEHLLRLLGQAYYREKEEGCGSLRVIGGAGVRGYQKTITNLY